MIYQLIYYSRYKAGAGALSMVRDILATSQANNSRDNITGFLIFDKESFVQILEGDQVMVDATYRRIERDPRHDCLTVVAAGRVPERAFPDWAMGGFIRSPDVQDIYQRYGFTDTIDPDRMKAANIVALASELLGFEQTRQQHRVIDVMSRD